MHVLACDMLRQRARVAVGAIALVLMLAPAATAGTVGLATKTLPSESLLVSTATFADHAGERNDVTVKVTATAVHVTDRAAAPVAVAGCAASSDPATVVCPLAKDHPALLLDIQAGGGDDALTMAEPVEPEIFDIIVGFLNGGEGNDTIAATSRITDSILLAAFLNGDGGDDRLVGGDGDDLLAGGAGRDTLIGAGGDDELDGDGAGRTATQFALALADKPFHPLPPAPPADDVLDGGPGSDSAGYARRTQPLRVDLADPSPDGSPGEADRLTGIENVSGGAGPNVLLGDAQANTLHGSRTASDAIDGRGGDDVLAGLGTGDVLRGGPGDDLLQQPGPGSTCGNGRDAIRNPRSAPEVLDGLAFAGCELALSRGGTVGLRLTRVRLRAGVFTIHVAPALRPRSDDPPVRVAIVTAGGRTLASRTLRLAGRRDRARPLTLRLRGRPPTASTVRVVLYEQDIPGRSLYVKLPLTR